MRFIQRSDHGAWLLDEYLRYVSENADRFPLGAREFATAEWHYDLKHSQCPHDAWLEEFVIREVASGERSQIRPTEISARFLGACHDGHFDLIYQGVSSYSLECTAREHGDWIVDEITLAGADVVHHEVIFLNGALSVDCADVRYRWTPARTRPT